MSCWIWILGIRITLEWKGTLHITYQGVREKLSTREALSIPFFGKVVVSLAENERGKTVWRFLESNNRP